jgi:transportin-1
MSYDDEVFASHTQLQQAACSSFATLEETAGPRLVPYLPHVLAFMGEAMERYQTRSLIALFDTLGTLADCVRHELAQPQLVAVFMPKARPCMCADHLSGLGSAA